MEKSTPMALIKATDIPAFREALKNALKVANEWMQENNEPEYDENDEEIEDDAMDFDPEFEEIAVENSDDILVGHEITDDRWGYLLHENGDIFQFLDENGIPHEIVQTIELGLLKNNPDVLGADQFYITEYSKAWLHQVGELIEIG